MRSMSSVELTKSHAKSHRIRRIQCENGLFLEVLCDGSLQGVKHKTTDYGKQSLFVMILMTGAFEFVALLLCSFQFCLITNEYYPSVMMYIH